MVRSPNRKPKPKTAFRRESNQADKLVGVDDYKSTHSNFPGKYNKGSRMITDPSEDKITLNLR